MQSLCRLAYENNPNFVQMATRLNLPFKAHEEFKKADIEERQELYQAICEIIWSFDLPE